MKTTISSYEFINKKLNTKRDEIEKELEKLESLIKYHSTQIINIKYEIKILLKILITVLLMSGIIILLPLPAIITTFAYYVSFILTPSIISWIIYDMLEKKESEKELGLAKNQYVLLENLQKKETKLKEKYTLEKIKTLLTFNAKLYKAKKEDKVIMQKYQNLLTEEEMKTCVNINMNRRLKKER